MKHPDVAVDADGRIIYAGQVLTQAESITLAYRLVDAVERSIDRNQRHLPSYYDSEAILRRIDSPLGVAKTALTKVYGLQP